MMSIRSFVFGTTILAWLMISASLFAATEVTFDSNQSRQWFSLETTHFIIHFRQGYNQLAERTAEVAERLHPVVVTRVGHEPAEKTYVILPDIIDIEYGRSLPLFHNQLILNVVPLLGGNHHGVPGTADNLLEQLFIHEYTHTVHADMNGGIYTSIRRLFGNVPVLSSPMVVESQAMLEGYATYEETLLGKGLGTTSFADMFLRAATLQQRVPTLDQLLGRYYMERWEPLDSVYLYGYSLLGNIAEHEGDTAVSRIHEAVAHTGVLGGPLAAIQEATNIPAANIYTRWKQDLEQRYADQQADVAARVVTPITPLNPVSKGWFSLWPRYSPDGTLMAYRTSGGTVGTSIRIRNVKSGEERAVAEGASDSPFDWTPDGRYIIYTAIKPVQNGSYERSDLFAVNVKSGEVIQLTSGMRAFAPAVSPDGKQVAFVKLDGVRVSSSVIVGTLREVNGHLTVDNFQPWSTEADFSWAVSIDWHPSGQKLAIERVDGQGRTGIYLLDVSGTLQTVLSESAYTASPVFTPDGQYLLFESDRTNVTNIYAYNLSTSELRQVTNVLNGAFCPAPSPDGKSLAVAYYTAAGYSIGTMMLNPQVWRKPDPMFTGIHWERAAWRRNAKVSSGGTVATETSEPRKRSYTVLPELLPTWWLPTVGSDGEGVTVGVVTAMMDSRERHLYTISANYGLGSELPAFSFLYRYNPTPFFGAGPSLGTGMSLDVTVAQSRVADKNKQELSLQRSAGLTVSYTTRAGLTAHPVSYRYYGGVGLNNTQQEKLIPITYAGWRVTSLGGIERFERLRSLEVQAEHALESEPTTVIIGKWSERAQRRLGGSLAASFSVGQAIGANGIGKRSDFAVRGALPVDTVTDATSAVKLTLAGETPLWKIYHGPAAVPVFFGRLVAAPFVDTALLNTPTGKSMQTSFGVELLLDTTLGYGFFSTRPSIGVAVVNKGNSQPQIRVIGGLRF